MIFCHGEGKYESQGIGYQQNYMAFNKHVSKERYAAIKNIISTILGNSFKLELNINSWSDGWAIKVNNDQWKEILRIPEADKNIIQKIIGFELKLDDKVEIIVVGKKIYISRESAKALNLI